MPVPGTITLIALIAHIGGPLLRMPSPDAALYTTAPSMGITITDDTPAVATGQPSHYRVTVHTLSTITFRVTFPSASSASSAYSASSVTDALSVAWNNTLPTGSTHTVSSRPHLDATACLHPTPDSPALTYATAPDTTTTPRERSLAWLASLLLGLLAVAGSIWLHRKVTPDLLTPANAAHDHPQAEQP